MTRLVGLSLRETLPWLAGVAVGGVTSVVLPGLGLLVVVAVVGYAGALAWLREEAGSDA